MTTREPGPPWTNDLAGDVAGPVVQVGAVHGGFYLRPRVGDQWPAPAQLAPVPWFVNREDLLARLDELVWQGSARLVVLCGLGGMGKTSAALTWLRRHAARWPDGQLYGDLAARADCPQAADGLLAGWLRALGLPGERVPVDSGELAGLWRSATAKRRLSLLVDGVTSPRQLRRLLPAGADCVVVATSRKHLPGLIADGARLLQVGPLPHEASVELLRTITTTTTALDPPFREEEAVLSRLARLCGQVPLTLTACGAHAAAHPHRGLAELAEDLHGRRRRLAARNETNDMKEIEQMTAVLDAAYAGLSPQAQRLYRGLGVHPSPEIGAGVAAAIAGAPLPDGGRLLGELFEVNLLAPGAELGRWRMHELVASHAAAQARAEGPDVVRELREVVLGWYLESAVAADLVIIGGRWHLGPAFERIAPAAVTAGEALAWVETELGNLVAATDAALEHGMPELAWQIAEAMWGFLLYRRPYPEWIHVHETGLRAAVACGDARAEARMRTVLGVADLDHGRLEQADEHFLLTLSLSESAGHPLGVATARDHLAQVALRHGQPDEAILHWQVARAVHIELGRPRGAALMLRHIGQAQLKAKRAERAIATLTDAIHETGGLPEPDPYNLARARTCLAEAHLAAAGNGRGRARPLLEQALQVMTERGATYQESVIHRLMAKTATTTAHQRNHLERALELLAGLHHPFAEEVAAQLTQLPDTGEQHPPGDQS